MNSIDITNVVAQHCAEHSDTIVHTFKSLSDLVAATPPASVIKDGDSATEAWGSAQLGQYIGAGVAMVGALGTGAGQGHASGAAALAVGRNPEAQPKILNTLIIGMAIAESAAIYCLIIAILILFVS